MTKKSEYPEWKILAWRFLRTGIAGGAATIIATTIALKPDLSNLKQYGFALLSAFIAGFIGATGKWIRDRWGEKDKSGTMDRIVI